MKLAKAFAKRFTKKDVEEETQSVVTSNTEEVSGWVNGKETITRDFGWTVNERQYKDKTPTLTKLGVQHFDRHRKVADLKLRLKSASSFLQKKLKTTDTDKIDTVLRRGLSKELISIQSRNDARKFAADRRQKDSSGSIDRGASRTLNMDSFSRPASEYGINARVQQKRSVSTERKTTPSPKIVRDS